MWARGALHSSKIEDEGHDEVEGIGAAADEEEVVDEKEEDSEVDMRKCRPHLQKATAWFYSL